jgi:cytochrome c553
MKLLTILLIALSFSACKKLGTDEAGTFQVVDLGEIRSAGVSFKSLHKLVLGPSCVRCHGWAETEAGVAGFLTAGKPNESKLYTRLVDPSLGPIMPLGEAPLSNDKIELVKEYIESLAPATTTPVEPPVQVEPEEPELLTFEVLKREVLVPHCQRCHNSETDTEENFVSWTEFFVTPMVIPGDAENSELYQMVLSGAMPKKAPKLSSDETNMIRDFINSLGPDEEEPGEEEPTEEEPTDPVGPADPVEPPAPVVTFEELNTKVLQQSCVFCHRGQMADEAALLGWQDFLGTSNIVKGDPENSVFYQLVDQNRMPIKLPPLGDTEKRLIYDYIKGLK